MLCELKAYKSKDFTQINFQDKIINKLHVSAIYLVTIRRLYLI
jgi:hypothetical protein